MAARPTLQGDGTKLASPSGTETSHLPRAQPSPEGTAPSSKPKAGRKCPSGRGFFKRKFPWWLKRKGPTNSPQGPAVSRNRLCVEVAHDSPIQAVRKPAPPTEALGANPEEGFGRGGTETSLLRRLLCLKATHARPREAASPLRRPRCGPVASLSRTADPHGDSPLRWKPRAETRSPEEAGSLAGPEKGATAGRLGAAWLEKPWRNLRTTMAAGAKRASFLSGSKRGRGAQPETSPVAEAEHSIGEPRTSVAAVEAQTLSPAPPPEADERYGGREGEGSHGTLRRPPKRAGGTSKPNWPVCEEGKPVLELVYEPEGSQRNVGALPGGAQLEAGGTLKEGGGPRQEEGGCWLGDLAELAENPGGQGMVMATRDLGWLDSEDLGGPSVGWKVKGKTAVSQSRDASARSEDAVSAARRRGSECSDEPASGAPLDVAGRGGCVFPTPLAEDATNRTAGSPPSATSALEEAGARSPVVWQGTSPPTLPEQGPLLSSRELHRRAEGSPVSGPTETLSLDPPGRNHPSQGSPWRLCAMETHGVAPGPAGPGEQKHLIYAAAVEIVEAAIDAAAEQLAKRRQQERGGPWGETAEASAGAGTRRGGNGDG